MPMRLQNRIEDVGLQRWLDDSKSEHNGLGYAEFVNLLKTVRKHAPIGRAFNVERRTISRWVERYNKEQA